jgi:prepilin-type processing-associated H-X9-DG protein
MGAYGSDEGAGFSDILGGASQTSLASEGLSGGREYRGERARLRMVWKIRPENGEPHANAVISLPSDPVSAGTEVSVHNWYKLKLFVVTNEFAASYTGPAANFYDHVVPPQNPTSHRITPASSDHEVVNVVYCDGHVSPIARNVDTQIWRDAGSVK